MYEVYGRPDYKVDIEVPPQGVYRQVRQGRGERGDPPPASATPSLRGERSTGVQPASMTARLDIPRAKPMLVRWRGFLSRVKRPRPAHRMAPMMPMIAK